MFENIVVKKIKGQWYIDIDGKRYTTETIHPLVGVSRTVVSNKLGRADTPEERAWAIRHLIFCHENDVPRGFMVYQRGDELCATPIVARKTGCTNKVAAARLKKWEEGKITTEQLFEPYVAPKRGRPKKGEDRFQGVPSRRTKSVRNQMLANIPGPTPIERQLWG